jgi:hypothetical protein
MRSSKRELLALRKANAHNEFKTRKSVRPTSRSEPGDTVTPTTTTKPLDWQRLIVFAAFAALSVRLLVLISQHAVNVFFMDQWEFNDATLFQPHSLWQMFDWQHGPHRQGLGAILSYFIEPHFRWNSRSESFLIWTIVSFAALCGLWLKKRLFGSIGLFDVCIPLILLNYLEYETLFITANLAHGPLPLVLVLLYCLAWTVSRPRLRYPLIVLINFVTIYTGFGFFLGLVTPAALAFDYWLNRRQESLKKIYIGASLLVSLASLGSFFFGYKFQTSVDCSPNLIQSPFAFFKFLLLIFANVLGAKGTGIFPVLVGAFLFAAILAALLLGLRALLQEKRPELTRSPSWVSAILLAYCLLFSVNAAYGRSCLGAPVAQVSRYVIYMELGVLGLYFVVLMHPKPAVRTTALLVLFASLAGTVPIRREDQQVMEFCKYAKLYWKACYFRTEDIRGCNHAVGYGVYPLVTPALKAKLDYLKQTKQNLYAGTP